MSIVPITSTGVQKYRIVHMKRHLCENIVFEENGAIGIFFVCMFFLYPKQLPRFRMFCNCPGDIRPVNVVPWYRDILRSSPVHQDCPRLSQHEAVVSSSGRSTCRCIVRRVADSNGCLLVRIFLFCFLCRLYNSQIRSNTHEDESSAAA